MTWTKQAASTWRGNLVGESEQLSLSKHQKDQAEAQRKNAEDAIVQRLPEAYQWLLVPVQTKPTVAVEWQATQLTAKNSLAPRVSKKLIGEELLFPSFAPTRLRMELDRTPLWDGNHVLIAKLFEHFASFNYLPRLRDSRVLVDAIQRGIALLTWRAESFAYADSYDDKADFYRGLVTGQQISIATSGGAVLVRSERAAEQQAREAAALTPPFVDAPWTPDSPYRNQFPASQFPQLQNPRSCQNAFTAA